MDSETAITRFCLAELRAAGRRMRHRLQRSPATGVFGDDYRHRTLWDELRFETENGPTPTLEGAWDQALQSCAAHVVAKMPPHTKALLSWHLAGMEEIDPDDAIDEVALADAICDSAKQLAAW